MLEFKRAALIFGAERLNHAIGCEPFQFPNASGPVYYDLTT
jgi:hypothetical protein